MHPAASAGGASLGRHGASPGKEQEQDRQADSGVEGVREGSLKANCSIPLVWQLAGEPWGILGKSQEERTEGGRAGGGGELFSQAGGWAGCMCLSGPELLALPWRHFLLTEQENDSGVQDGRIHDCLSTS